MIGAEFSLKELKEVKRVALAGAPLGPGFCSQDLLIHGTLMSHPLTGLLLPIATAMNTVRPGSLFLPPNHKRAGHP